MHVFPGKFDTAVDELTEVFNDSLFWTSSLASLPVAQPEERMHGNGHINFCLVIYKPFNVFHK